MTKESFSCRSSSWWLCKGPSAWLPGSAEARPTRLQAASGWSTTNSAWAWVNAPCLASPMSRTRSRSSQGKKSRCTSTCPVVGPCSERSHMMRTMKIGLIKLCKWIFQLTTNLNAVKATASPTNSWQVRSTFQSLPQTVTETKNT